MQADDTRCTVTRKITLHLQLFHVKMHTVLQSSKQVHAYFYTETSSTHSMHTASDNVCDSIVWAAGWQGTKQIIY